MKIHERCVEESTFTFVAEIFWLSDRISITDAPLWNPVPIISDIETDVPALPFSGVIPLILGFIAMVLVVASVDVVATVPVRVVTAVREDVMTVG